MGRNLQLERGLGWEFTARKRFLAGSLQLKISFGWGFPAGMRFIHGGYRWGKKNEDINEET